MKYLILLLTLLLAGCKTTKQLTASTASASRSDSVLTARVDSTRVSRDTTSFATTNSAARDERTVVVITEYDTSKPVDYATGKPPVLRKSYYKSEANTKQNASMIATSARLDSTNVLKSDSTAIHKATDDSAQITQEIKREGAPWWVSVIAIAGLAIVLVILIRRWVNR